MEPNSFVDHLGTTPPHIPEQLLCTIPEMGAIPSHGTKSLGTVGAVVGGGAVPSAFPQVFWGQDTNLAKKGESQQQHVVGLWMPIPSSLY
mmetsp:Transcript_22820/g.38826  ORF Transcript_22820/g.38826 Transcript_22820/m.38826 type:complete len:90 (+) Transcript_22820:99-368(+)